MGSVRALPTVHLMPAAGPRQPPVATGTSVDVPKRTGGRTHRRVHPIRHHVTGPRSAHPDKAGRRRAPQPRATYHNRPQETDMTPT
jgi:hypothetical protein